MTGSGTMSDGWNAFLASFLDIWEFSAWGVTLGQVAIAAVVISVGVAFRRALATWALGRLRALAANRKAEVVDQVLGAVGVPLTYVPVLLAAFIAVQELGLGGAAAAEGLAIAGVADNALTTATAVLVFWTLIRLVDPLVDGAAGLRRFLSRTLLDWLRRALKTFLVFVGGAAILEDWGIPVGPILASLGIFGVAVALGAQDLFKNLIAGLLILSERRFEAGDWIKVDGVVEGTVERIGFRSTHVRRFDKGPVYVPNAHLADNPLTNFSRMTHRRIYWMIGVEYGTSVEQLRTIRDQMMDYIETSDDFANPSDVSTFVRIDKFNDSSIDYMLYCFTKTINWGEWLEIKERLALKIKEIVEGAGADFAFPSRTLYLAGDAQGDAPEVFTPPRARSASGAREDTATALTAASAGSTAASATSLSGRPAN